MKSGPWQGHGCQEHKCDSLDLELVADFPRSVTILKRLFSDPLINVENLRLWAALEEKREVEVKSYESEEGKRTKKKHDGWKLGNMWNAFGLLNTEISHTNGLKENL